MAPQVLNTSTSGPMALNKLARQSVRSGGFVRWRGKLTASVRWHQMSFTSLAGRPDAHAIMGHKTGRTADCSHWCYSPLLWDSILLPLYRTLAEHFNVSL